VASANCLTSSAATTAITNLASTLSLANSKIAAISPTIAGNHDAVIDNSTEAVSLLAQIIRVQSLTKGTVSDTVIEYATKVGKGLTATYINDAVALSDANIAAAPVGLIVPARVSIASIAPSSAKQLEGEEGALTPYTIT